MFPSSETHETGETGSADDLVPLDDLANEFQGLERDALRALGLERLRALTELRAASRGEEGAEATLHRRLLDRAIFSVYEDCVAAGARDEAQALLSSTP